MKKYILPLILILFLTFTLIGNCADWLSGEWDYRIELSIADYAGDIGAEVTWFPVTVFLTDSQCEEIFTELTTDTEYLKVAFTKADGETELYAEKELFTHTSFFSDDDVLTGGTASADTDAGAGYEAAKGNDNDLGTRWTSDNSALPHWWKYDLGEAVTKTVRKLRIHKFWNVSGSILKDFTLQGSNNDSDWDVISTEQAADAGEDAIWEEFTFANSTAYRYYLINITTNYREDNYAAFWEVEMLEIIPKGIFHVSRDGWIIDANTSIFMYYDADHANNDTYIGAIGARTEVWDGNFKAVHHMADATTSTVKDSTSNNNDGTKTSADNPIQTADGKVGYAQDFSSDHITVSDDPTLNFGSGNFTIETCLKMDDITDPRYFLWKRGGTPATGYYIFYHHVNYSYSFLFGDYTNSNYAYLATQSDWDDTDWHYLAVKRTGAGNTGEIWVDGVSQDLDDGSVGTAGDTDTATDLTIGEKPGVDYMAGILDEKRISSGARSDAWIKGTYNSLWDTLLTYGSEELAEEAEEANAIFFGTNF